MQATIVRTQQSVTMAVATAITLALTAMPAAAATPPPVRIGDMLVTAAPTSRKPETVPAAVTVITAEQIATSAAQTVPDLLRHVAGVNVADWMGNARRTNVDIRGFGETAAANTLVLVDGHKINAADLSGIDWTLIPLDRIARIEVYRGGAGVLYGNLAVAGVINIITRKGAEGVRLTSETAVQSHQGFKQSLGLSGASGPWNYALDGSYRSSDGYRANSNFRNRSSGLRLGYDNGGLLGLDMTASMKADAYGLPGALREGLDPRDSTTPLDHSEGTDQNLTVTPTLQIGETGQLALGLSLREMEQRSVFTGFVTEFRIREYGVAPKYTQSLDLAGMQHTLTFGIDYLAENLHHLSQPDQDMHRHETAYYVYDTVDLIPDTLVLDLGYRRARISYDQHGYFVTAWGTGKISDQNHSLNAARAGLAWHPGADSKVFVGWDRTYRTQLLDEVGGPWGNNTPLDPQTADHWQFGFEHSFCRFMAVGATVFQIDTTDEIFYNPMIFENTNYESTRRRGLELELESRPCESLLLFANYTWLHARLEDDPFAGNSIPGVTPQSGSVGASFTPIPELTVALRGRWVKNKKMISDWGNTNESWGGSYFVVDASVAYTIGWVTLYAGVDNLFAEEYAEYGAYWGNTVNLYPSPERIFVAGIRIVKDL